MNRTLIILLSFFWLGNLSSQNWVNMIDSMPNSRLTFQTSVVDTVSNTLYIGGDFQQINNLTTKSIIKFNGATFDTLGAGIDPQEPRFSGGQIKKMVMFQNKLYVSGAFQKAGKYYSPNLARYNGTDWDTVNFKFKGSAWNMTVYNNELYVAGYFDSIGGIKANSFAKFDGANWHNIGYSYSTCVSAIENYKGKLYMAGEVTSGGSCSNLAFYDGVTWQPWYGVNGSPTKTVWGMKTIDSMLFVYGRFYSIGGVYCSGLAAWNGTKWFDYGLGVGQTGTIWDVSKINGSLYISGVFDSINDVSSNNGQFNFFTNVGKFDGDKWCTLMEPFNNPVSQTIQYNNNMYMIGGFNEVGNHTSVLPFLKWTGGNSTFTCGNSVGVGINEISVSENIKVYPNPANDILNIEDEQNDLRNTTIIIANPLGDTIISMPFQNAIDISHLNSGIYFLTIQSSSTRKTIKIVKQ